LVPRERDTATEHGVARNVYEYVRGLGAAVLDQYCDFLGLDGGEDCIDLRVAIFCCTNR
jgi:hypothetical protein